MEELIVGNIMKVSQNMLSESDRLGRQSYLLELAVYILTHAEFTLLSRISHVRLTVRYPVRVVWPSMPDFGRDIGEVFSIPP